jgi:hypothetical protein
MAVCSWCGDDHYEPMDKEAREAFRELGFDDNAIRRMSRYQAQHRVMQDSPEHMELVRKAQAARRAKRYREKKKRER